LSENARKTLSMALVQCRNDIIFTLFLLSKPLINLIILFCITWSSFLTGLFTPLKHSQNDIVWVIMYGYKIHPSKLHIKFWIVHSLFLTEYLMLSDVIIVKNIIQKATEMLNACQKMPEQLWAWHSVRFGWPQEITFCQFANFCVCAGLHKS
jgi:hypothetical protein